MKYNSQDVERIAARVSALSGSVISAANGSLKHTADELPVHFKGEAAQELQVALNGLFSDIHSCGSKLSKLAEILYFYAARLREADEAAKEDIIQH